MLYCRTHVVNSMVFTYMESECVLKNEDKSVLSLMKRNVFLSFESTLFLLNGV